MSGPSALSPACGEQGSPLPGVLVQWAGKLHSLSQKQWHYCFYHFTRRLFIRLLTPARAAILCTFNLLFISKLVHTNSGHRVGGKHCIQQCRKPCWSVVRCFSIACIIRSIRKYMDLSKFNYGLVKMNERQETRN